MSDYRVNQIPCTMGLVAIASIMIMPAIMPKVSIEEPLRMPHVYSSIATSSTVDRYRHVLSGEYPQQVETIEQALLNVYSQLFASQEALGSEFEKVLYDNLWDLYES